MAGALLAGCAERSSPPPQGAVRDPAGPNQAVRDQYVVLVSLDGFRWDYVDRPPAVHLRRLAARGVRARWMTPVFPTKTFPNHYTIATGLYPEHHGIVGNTMHDPRTGAWFRLSDPEAVRDPVWWSGEPIWVTAVKQGRRSAAFFWPGTDVPIERTRPTYWQVYDRSVPNARRVAQVLEWLALPESAAPAVVTLYFSDVDAAGHDRGPDAPETDAAIARVDSAVGALVAGIEARGLTARVNLIVVSDHGMAAVPPDQVIYLDDYVDLAKLTVVEWSPVAAIDPGAGRVDEVYRRLQGAHPHLTVYRKEDIPARYHYRDHPRIPPIVALADEGWMISSRRKNRDLPASEQGTHGYDPAIRSMQALFIAAGPAFAEGVTVQPFGNVHLYALMCHVLGLQPAPNDGVLDSVRAVLRTPR